MNVSELEWQQVVIYILLITTLTIVSFGFLKGCIRGYKIHCLKRSGWIIRQVPSLYLDEPSVAMAFIEHEGIQKMYTIEDAYRMTFDKKLAQ